MTKTTNQAIDNGVDSDVQEEKMSNVECAEDCGS